MSLFILLAIALFFAIFAFVRLGREWDEWGFGTLIGLMILVFGSGLSFVIASGIDQSGPVAYQTVQTDNLVALGNSSATSGHFFLGSGYVGTHLTYSYITEDAQHGFHLHSATASYATVYEDSKDGTATKVTKTDVYNNWWALPFAQTVWGTDGVHTAFHVPKGTVDQSFKVSVTPGK